MFVSASPPLLRLCLPPGAALHHSTLTARDGSLTWRRKNNNR
jgi:hypothetical protein